jgi:hypothetical protein
MDAFIKPVILSCPNSVQCELRQGFQGVSSLEVFGLNFNVLNETGEAAVSYSKRILLYGATCLVINLYFFRHIYYYYYYYYFSCFSSFSIFAFRDFSVTNVGLIITVFCS